MISCPKPKRIDLNRKDYQELRRQAWSRAGGLCENEDCGSPAPLEIGGEFVLWGCGHLAHIKSKGAGGDDTLDNVRWLCPKCHGKTRVKCV